MVLFEIITLSKLLGFIGLIIGISEVWNPKLVSFLEGLFIRMLNSINEFRVAYSQELSELVKIGSSAINEAKKGPQIDRASGQGFAQILLSFQNIVRAFWFYFATLIYFIVIKPFFVFVIFITKLGKGRALAGLTIVIGIATLLM